MFISSKKNSIHLSNPEARKPKGVGLSPYPVLSSLRYLINNLFNGLFSYINPDRDKMKLLAKEGRIKPSDPSATSLKVVFLGDIMVSKSGKPPELNNELKDLLKSADIIIANVESPVIHSEKTFKRGLNLYFEMNDSYLADIYDINRTAKWVFSIANNHACDTSRKSKDDVSGVERTIDTIKAAIPSAEVIGAEIGTASPVLSLQVDDGPKIGIVGWTEVMNHDKEHYRKGIIRETDLTDAKVAEIKNEHDLLIGFVHGNEEQSYYPLKKTRDRWCNMMGEKKFDIIVGHGPHVLQPAEMVGEEGLLFNSIGNFCSPVGNSQTKVGCVPEIDLNYQHEKISSIGYRVNLLQQQNESVSLLDETDPNKQLDPSISERLRKIWVGLF